MGRPVLPIAFQFTAAEITAGLANNLPKGTAIIVVDANSQPIDIKVAQGGGTPPVDSAGLKNNFAGAAAPLVTNDSSQGYSVGSRWIDAVGDESYICVDATLNNAVWSKSTVGTIAEVANLQSTLDGKSATTHNHDTAYTAVAHGTSTTNPHSVTKTQVGLGNVDNTADTAKPVSTAQQTALNLKQDASTAATDAELSALTATVINHGLNTDNPHTVNKEQVGLGLAENTADASKPISTAQQTALNAKQELYEGTVALRTPSNLTSNTSNPNYILTASSEHTIHLFYRAFDNNDTTLWYTAGVSVATGVIELNYKIRPTNLLLRGDVASEYWTRWQLQGSKDGTNWDTLVDRSGVDEEIRATSKNFSITTSKEYKHFRFNGLGAVGTNIPISRLEISGVESATTTVNNTLTSTSTTEALSANQGKTLKDTADTLATTVASKLTHISISTLDANSTALTDNAIYTGQNNSAITNGPSSAWAWTLFNFRSGNWRTQIFIPSGSNIIYKRTADGTFTGATWQSLTFA